MLKRFLLAALCLVASPAALAVCTASIDYDAGVYASHPNLDGVGWGSLDPERQNAAFTAMGIYRTKNGANSLPANSRMCVTYDDNSTESFNVRCNTSPACLTISGDHSPPASAGGGASGYYWYTGVWHYSANCYSCGIHYGTVGEPYTPPPPGENSER